MTCTSTRYLPVSYQRHNISTTQRPEILTNTLPCLPLSTSRQDPTPPSPAAPQPPQKMITGLSHINLLVPPGTLPLATAFYSKTLGLRPRPVPAHRVHDLAWFEIGDSGQEVHIAPDYNGSNINGNGNGNGSDGEDVETKKSKWSSRHPCFRLGSAEQLEELRVRIWECFEAGGEAAPLEADRPGGVASGMLLSYFFFLSWVFSGRDDDDDLSKSLLGFGDLI